jgi:hypothetical protein
VRERGRKRERERERGLRISLRPLSLFTCNDPPEYPQKKKREGGKKEASVGLRISFRQVLSPLTPVKKQRCSFLPFSSDVSESVYDKFSLSYL